MLPGVQLLRIPAFSVVPDPNSDIFYLSVGNPAAEHEDSLVAISGETGSVLWELPIGGAPSALAVSDDGTTAYIGTRDNPAIVRVDLQSRQETARYPTPVLVNPLVVYDMDVVPGNPNQLVVVYSGLSDYSNLGEAILLDSGVQVGQPTPSYVAADEVAIQDAATAHAFDSTSTAATLVTLAISDAGLTPGAFKDDAVEAFTHGPLFDGQWLLLESGEAVEPSTYAPVGRYAQSGSLVSNPAANRVYVAAQNRETSLLELTVFDRQTFAELGRLVLTPTSNTPRRMAQSKGGSLAIVTEWAIEYEQQVILISPSTLDDF
jgi:DNA-binding beta-propeller fold protein YncE